MTTTSDKRLIGSAHWALADQVVISGASFLVGILIARALPSNSLAVYSLAITTVLCLSSIHRAWIAQPMNILGAQESAELRYNRYHQLMQAQGLLLPVIFGVVICIGMLFFPERWLVLGAACYTIIYILQDLIRRFHYTDGSIHRALSGDILAFGGQCLLIISMIALDGVLSVRETMWWLALPLILSAWWMHKSIRHAHRGFFYKSGRSVLSYLQQHWLNARWVVLSQLVWIGASQLIPFQLASLANTSDVATYHAANTMINALNVFRLTLGNYLPGQAARVLSLSGARGLRTYLLKIGALCMVITFAALIFVELTGSFWIDLLFSGKYQAVNEILGPLVVIHLLAMSALITSSGTQVLGCSRVIFTSNVLALLLALSVGSWFISLWGVWGSVPALAIGLLFPAGIQLVYLERHFQRLFSEIPE